LASAIGKMSHLPHTVNHREARRERERKYKLERQMGR